MFWMKTKARGKRAKLNKQEFRNAFAGASNMPLFQAVLQMIEEMREECVVQAVDMSRSDADRHASAGAVNICEDLKRELEAQVEAASTVKSEKQTGG